MASQIKIQYDKVFLYVVLCNYCILYYYYLYYVVVRF